jgi:O-antigen/teichoic acid export membrane protein
MREFLRDAAKYFPSQVLPAIVGFISIPLLTHAFSPGEYGDYRLVLAAIGVITPAASWVSYATYRFFPEYEMEDRLGYFYSTSLRSAGYTQLGVVAVLLVVVLAAGGSLSERLSRLALLGLGLLVTRIVFSTLASFVRSRREAGWFSVSVVTQNLVGLGVGALLVFGLSSGIEGFLLGLVVGGIVVMPMMWWRTVRGIDVPWRDRLDRGLAREMFRYSYPLVLGLSATWLLRLSDRFILELFRGSDEVGIYAASYGLADAGIGMIVTVFQLPFSVSSNRVFEREGEQAAARFVSDSARWLLLVSIPSVVGLSVLARPLVAVMTGAAFLDGYRIIPYVSIATLLGGLAMWYSSAFLFRKRTNMQAVAIGVGALVNIGLNLLLVPSFGFYAAGITTLLGFLAVNVVSYVFGKRMFSWHLPIRSIGRALVASLVMALVVLGVESLRFLASSERLVVAVVAGVIVYFATLYLMREFSSHELAQARGFLRRKVPR